MTNIRLSKLARQDIDSIWDYTEQNYSMSHADAYTHLIEQALNDIQENPERPGTTARPELGGFIRSYAISLSKDRSNPKIKSPRHIIIYTLEHEGEIFVLRILHDSMDSERHLPEGD